MSQVTSVIVSQCGNFGVLGYDYGALQKFNMQSGEDRGMFIGKHDKEVTGLAMD